MSVTYEVVSSGEHTIDVITDERAGLRIMVVREGAELVSIARRDRAGVWQGFLHRDGDVSPAPSGWNNHATVMGYYIHRLVDGRSTYRGRPMRGDTHSFLRHKLFEAPHWDEGAGSLAYHLPASEILPSEYPLEVPFTLTYALDGDTLRTTFHFENREKQLTAHVSFGLHPGFAATLETCEVLLPQGRYVRHLAPGNFLSGEVVEFDHPGGPMPFSKADLPGSFLLDLKGVPAPIFVFADRPSGRQVHLNFAGAPYATLWSDGNPFICIEPCWGLPDHHDQRPFEEKSGIQEIAPGGILRRSFTMALSFLG